MGSDDEAVQREGVSATKRVARHRTRKKDALGVGGLVVKITFFNDHTQPKG